MPALWATPAAAVELAWQHWAAAATQPGHPCRLAALATSAADRPAVRTVVLRQCDPVERELTCYSDARSDKIAQLTGNPLAELMAYDAPLQLQLRAFGSASLITDEQTRSRAWAALSERQRADYSRATQGAASDQVAEHFRMISLRVERLDILHLGPFRQVRVRAIWQNQGWQAEEILP